MALIDAIRQACRPELWSSGVRLARAEAVVGESADAEEVILRVTVAGRTVPHTVYLWPEEEDWSCDCESAHSPCGHVAAAVIAWAQGVKEGTGLPTGAGAGPAPARLGYRLLTTDRGFSIDRVLVREGEETRLPGALSSAIREGDRVISNEADLEIEAAMGYRFGVSVERERVARLLGALGSASDITIDGEKVGASDDPVIPICRVEDDKALTNRDGFRVRIVRDTGITNVFRNGSVICGGQIRPVSKGPLSKEEYSVLTRGVQYQLHEVGTLVAEVIPGLRRKVPVEIRTKRLPQVESTPPRLSLLTSGLGDELAIRAEIVYGDPPVARVERGEMMLLGAVVPIRDKRAEERLSRQVSEDLGLALGLERRYRREEAVRFVERLGPWTQQLTGNAWERFQRAAPIQPSLEIRGDRLELNLGGADPHRVIEAWLSGESLVAVRDGWADIPREWLEQYGHKVADLLAARDSSGKVARHALFDLARLARELNQPPPAELEGLKALLDDFTGIPVAVLPADLQATLRPYQQRGVDWLAVLRDAGLGGILADDMGLGKTVQALCAVRGLVLVVAPTSVIPNWANEIRRFRPALTVCTYHGPGRVLDADADVVLTTYGLLRGDIEFLSNRTWQAVVLDEAQAIKNPDSQVARAAYRLKADFRLTLTGTPIENRLDELWSQMHFTNPGLLGGRRDFQERYARPISVGEPGVAAHLRDRIRPFVLRRMKEEVAPDLPPRTDMVLHCELSREERVVYDAVRAASREKVAAELGHGGNVLAALEALLRLRQASCHPSLIPGQHAESSSKVDLLVETLDEVVAEGHKALVFSQWTSLLNLIEPQLRKAGIPWVRLDGSTRDRGAVVAHFQSAEGPPVFLISLKAGGTGLNLTEADHVFLMDPWWNPAVEKQATDRAHRIGQDKPVMVYRLVAEDTVEGRILQLQDRKRALAEAALGGADQAASITREELLALID